MPRLTENAVTRLARRPMVARWLARIVRLEGEMLAIAAAMMLGLALVIALAENVYDFDTAALLAFRTVGNPADPIGPPWFEEMMRDFTALGSTGVLTMTVLAVAGFLVITRKSHSAILMVASVLGGMLLSSALKFLFDRARPDVVPHAAEVYTASFPSGHSLMAAVVYLTLGALLARTQSSRAVRAYILLVAMVLALLVGISRVYLGVHWPSDVIGGWAIGSLWALVCWLLMVWLQLKGRVEPEE